MENLVSKIIRILKEHVDHNNEEIRMNQDEIKRMLSEMSGESKQKDLDYKNSLNKELLDENEEFIRMQMQLNDFMDKFGHLFTEIDEFEDMSLDDESLPYFEKTISGKLEFDSYHPQFNNPVFFKELIRHYQNEEDYEKCDQLMKIKQKGKSIQ